MKIRFTRVPLLLALLLSAGCANDENWGYKSPGVSKGPNPPRSLAQILDTANLPAVVEIGHQKAKFKSHQTVSFDLELDRPGQKPLRAAILQRTDGTGIRLRKTDGSGTELLWDGADAWIFGPSEAPGFSGSPNSARFDLFAWHYFFCLPFKLDDPGVGWQPMPDRTLDGRDCSVGRLTFAPGTGDAPEDWFVVFADRGEGLVRAANYISTLGQKPGGRAAAKEPRTIFYEDYAPADGIPVARRWRFFGWDTDSLGGKKALGSAIIRNVRFAEEGPMDFQAGPGGVKL